MTTMTPGLSWAESGMAYLTRDVDGAADHSRAAVLTEARRLASDFGVDAGELLAGRAGLMGTVGGGRLSAGGATRLLRAADGWLAVSLARDTDVDSVPALVRHHVSTGAVWEALAAYTRGSAARDAADRAQLLGIPAAVLAGTAPAAPVRTRLWPTRARAGVDGDLLVVDLSALWAGPLCGMLLASLGATVLKVESPDRPDGARRGNRDFHTWMNSGKHQVVTPLRSAPSDLHDLLDVADVVIEASRPRALRQLGLDAMARRPRPGRVWVRITGYGPDDDRVAFGDDAAVAGGLVGRVGGAPVFCGDAVADPLTGITAAHEVLASLRLGGGEVIDISLAGVAARFAALPAVSVPDPPPAPRPPAPPAQVTSVPARSLGEVLGMIARRRGRPC